MFWSGEAEDAVKKVPFFVRKKVRARVEREAAAAGKKSVSLADVKRTQARFLANMSQEVKGYQVDTCFGGGGCPNRVLESESLLEQIEGLFKKADLLAFLKQNVNGDLKFHHEFRVTLAECPNACSQPQIKDIGIIGATCPLITDAACSACGACVDACPDGCVVLPETAEKPRIDLETCMHCGKCAAVCPTGTIVEKQKGFRVLLGGKLGRHPQLARELPGIYAQSEVLDIVQYCITFFKQHGRNGKRFATVFQPADVEALVERIQAKRSHLPADKEELIMEKQDLTIPNISCGHCVAAIKDELSELPGVGDVSGDPASKVMHVEWDAPATLAAIRQKLQEINYPAE